jgi:ABC-type lipoprotein export system ATPase subunit
MMDTATTHNGSHTLLGAEISGGFLEGERLEFTSGLNCIIGGRGTGKTTILEFIRYTLGLMPDPKQSPRSRSHSVVQNNLANGRIKLDIKTAHGMRYTADRPWNHDCQVLNEQGDVTAISLSRDQIFKADIYSQNEIEQIATDSGFQLKLIDQFEEENIRRINSEINKLLRDIEYNAGELHQTNCQMEDLSETATESTALEEKLKGFQNQNVGPDADAINAAHLHKALRDREAQALSSLRKEIGAFSSRFQKGMDSLAQKLNSHFNPEFMDGPNGEIFESASSQIQSSLEEIFRTIPIIEEQCQIEGTELSEFEKELVLRHGRQEQFYREMLEKSQEEQGRTNERNRLQKRLLKVTEANRNLEELKKRHTEGRESLQIMMSRLSDLRDQRYRHRRDVADRLTKSLNPTIRVTVTQEGNRKAFVDLLSEGLKGSGLKYSAIVEKMVNNISPEELATIIQRQDVNRLSEMAGLDTIRSARIIDLLSANTFSSRLMTIDLEDLPCIELLDGMDYKDASALSTGQRCTTILPILLLESDRPLLIDQPEDNLDNAFIFETIVQSVKKAKAARQLIFVTHNPNIPVLGEAERVFVLSSDGRHGSVNCVGTVDEVKGEIETLLEGGREAFLQRKERYGH